MQDELGNQPNTRGGRRPSAGRKVKRINALVKRCDRATAAMILAVVDEQSKVETADENSPYRNLSKELGNYPLVDRATGQSQIKSPMPPAVVI